MKLIYNKKVLFAGNVRDLNSILKRISTELNVPEENIQIEYSRDELNFERDKKLSILTVSISIDGKEITLDADKDSQDNIKTAILALEDSEKTLWLTKDNQQIELTREQLKEALRKVGEKKREIIFSYRAKKDAL